MKKIEGKIKIIGKEGKRLGGDSEIYVVTEDGTEIDISGTVKGFVYTAIAGDVAKVELMIYPNKFDGLADENLIVDVEGNPS